MAAVRVHTVPSRWRRSSAMVVLSLTSMLLVTALIPCELAVVPEGPDVVAGATIAGAEDASDEELLRRGRVAFYAEDFGNDVFFTDVLGLVSGPVRLPAVMGAAFALGGAGTTNLRVELAEDATIGETRLPRGTVIDTGLDVVRGSSLPLGLVVHVSDLRVRVGVTCALCHSTVDPETGQAIHGAANGDLNAGLLLALASNSAAYFTHTDVRDPPAVAPGGPAIVDSRGRTVALPERRALEDAVDVALAAWPPGFFDATSDSTANPTRIPDVFTHAESPYGWSGAGVAGPFRGLSSFANNLHALNVDPLARAHLSWTSFGLDPEVYVGTILQGSPRGWLRFQPGRRASPLFFLAGIDPTPGAPGLNLVTRAPTFPKSSAVALDGVFVEAPDASTSGLDVAIAAWLSTLGPPEVAVDDEAAARGREVFARAGCGSCHAGPAYSIQTVLPAEQIGTEPARARALAYTRGSWTDAVLLYAPGTPVPVPRDAPVVQAPLTGAERARLALALGHEGGGGYKVPGLLGLWWSAPYLHDGGVAVSPDEGLVGVGNTRGRGVPVDPRSSLRALVDRELRGRVVAANRADARRWALHIRGTGHEFWVDGGAGFSPMEQREVIEFLLSLRPG